MEKKETTYPKVTLCDTTYIPSYDEYKENCEATDKNYVLVYVFFIQSSINSIFYIL